MIKKVAVIGAGTMGHGIAQVAALAGCSVAIRDVDPKQLDKALVGIQKSLDKAVEKGKVTTDQRSAALALVRVETDLGKAVSDSDLVVEAVPERLELKQKVFADVAALARTDAILATNTSSLSISAIAQRVPHPQRFVGMHFFNPVPVMKLVEVVRGSATDAATADAVCALARTMAKEPIVVRDSPGFATSRLGVAIGLEAIRMKQEDVASAEDIDKAMTLGYNHPMGPLRLTDLVGLDVRLGISEYLAKELGPRFEPPDLLKKMVTEGKLGQKSGQGFYEWK